MTTVGGQSTDADGAVHTDLPGGGTSTTYPGGTTVFSDKDGNTTGTMTGADYEADAQGFGRSEQHQYQHEQLRQFDELHRFHRLHGFDGFDGLDRFHGLDRSTDSDDSDDSETAMTNPDAATTPTGFAAGLANRRRSTIASVPQTRRGHGRRSWRSRLRPRRGDTRGRAEEHSRT